MSDSENDEDLADGNLNELEKQQGKDEELEIHSDEVKPKEADIKAVRRTPCRSLCFAMFIEIQ